MNTSTDDLIVLKELQGNPPTSLDPLQQVLAPYIEELTAFWVAVWCMTAVVLVVHLVREYRKHKGYDK
jgi:hypothetical protein